MTTAFPFLTSYDPPGTSEGTIDPLGLYQIADQLAVKLVPAVRERMQRIRFLTAMAVGSLVTEDIDDDPRQRDASPYLVWEWLVIEVLIRELYDDPGHWGVPGTQVTRRALAQHRYLDARSYLKTPRIFGFHGVYKRLAVHIGVVDIHLRPGPMAEGLVDTWARGMGLRGLKGARPVLDRWTHAVRRSLSQKPPRTRPGWYKEDWAELARAFAPARSKLREKRYLRRLLLKGGEDHLGALPVIWELQGGFDDDGYAEEQLHNRLEKREPRYRPLLEAVRSYETFARSLQDGFDLLKAEAAGLDARGYAVPDIARDEEFKQCVNGLHNRFEMARSALGEAAITDLSLQGLFDERFGVFAQPLDPATCAMALCEHHEKIQRGKSPAGKRPWFDRIGKDRIYIRHAYRKPRQDIRPGRYVHAYRGWPIRRFYKDLS